MPPAAGGLVASAHADGGDHLSVQPILSLDSLEQVHPPGGPGLGRTACCMLHGSSVDGVQLPVAGDALEQVGPSIAEPDPGASH